MPKNDKPQLFSEAELAAAGFTPPEPQKDEDGNPVPTALEFRLPMRVSAEDYDRLPSKIRAEYEKDGHEDDGHRDALWVRA